MFFKFFKRKKKKEPIPPPPLMGVPVPREPIVPAAPPTEPKANQNEPWPPIQWMPAGVPAHRDDDEDFLRKNRHVNTQLEQDPFVRVDPLTKPPVFEDEDPLTHGNDIYMPESGVVVPNPLYAEKEEEDL